MQQRTADIRKSPFVYKTRLQTPSLLFDGCAANAVL